MNLNGVLKGTPFFLSDRFVYDPVAGLELSRFQRFQ